MKLSNLTTTLTGAALIAILAATGPASAAATMCDAKAMTKESMAKDDTAMSGDAMMSDDMANDDMAKGDMAMADDAMKSDDMAMADDTMKDETMSGDDMMMGSYTVKRGDSLWKIAAATLCDGDRYPEIVAANSDMLGDAMMIHPGDTLTIPGD